MPSFIDPSPSNESPARGEVGAIPSRSHDPYAAFRSRAYSLFSAGNLLSIIGRQMLAVAVEWEIYARTHSATALGLVGLVIAIPVVGFSLPAGHLADRFSRRRMILVTQVFSAFASLALACVSWNHLAIPPVWPIPQMNHLLSSVAAVFEKHHPA